MPQYIGVDIIEILRIRQACTRWGEVFLERVFTPREISLYRNQYPSLAARFAAKEAVIKAFGEPRRFPMKWTDIEVFNDSEGKPIVELHDDALKLKKRKKVNSIILSMAHSRNYAVANAILIKKGR